MKNYKEDFWILSKHEQDCLQWGKGNDLAHRPCQQALLRREAQISLYLYSTSRSEKKLSRLRRKGKKVSFIVFVYVWVYELGREEENI